MMRLFGRSKNFFVSSQNSILAGAAIIMVMVLFSSLLGLVRQRLFLQFFKPEELSLFYASFRIPDLVFQLLAFGIFSSAFIPVFTKVRLKDTKLAFEVAASVLNVALVGFFVFAVLFALLASPVYAIIAPGYSDAERMVIVSMARILLLAEGLFVASYILTGVLESHRRFFISALAPIFYNIGIIIVTMVFSQRLGLFAPAIGVVFGALLHLLVQAPAVYKLGFRPSFSLKITAEVKKIGKLAAPRVLELGSLELSRMGELFFTSIISTAALTYYNLADAVRIMPITLFGVSLAKSALPALAQYDDDLPKFRKTFLKTLYQICFFVMPVAATLMVLRIPIVRLLFGTNKFDWEATVQTGLVLSVFAFTLPFQSSSALLSRAFYARHNTKTPVKTSILGVVITIILNIILVALFHLPTWALAVSYTTGMVIQTLILYYLLSKELNGGTLFAFVPILKSAFASLVSGSFMYVVIKFFDRSVWVKRLSFVTDIKAISNWDFERFVIDTRYTFNLLVLTAITAILGGLVYLIVSYILGSEELKDFIQVLKRRSFSVPEKEEESLSTTSN